MLARATPAAGIPIYANPWSSIADEGTGIMVVGYGVLTRRIPNKPARGAPAGTNWEDIGKVTADAVDGTWRASLQITRSSSTDSWWRASDSQDAAMANVRSR